MKDVSGNMAVLAEGWFVRLMSPDCPPSEHAAFERWLQSDRNHATAYAATERLWSRLEGIELDPQIGAAAAEALVPKSARYGWAIPAALAASAVLAVLILYVVNVSAPSGQDSATYRADNEPRHIQLTDGSVIQLDAGAELAIDFTPQQRRVRLHSGRALFDVAPNRTAPFTVSTGMGEVIAVGTRFQVDRQDGSVKVMLAEGAVVVKQTLQPAAGGTNGAPQTMETRLRPGEELTLTAAVARPWSRQSVDADLETSWSRGYHVFRAKPLAQALEEINRYASPKLRLADPALADLPLSGSFKIGDGLSIATSLPAVLPVLVRDKDGVLELSAR